MSVEVYPDETSWLAARRRGIGASEVPAVLGVSRYQSPMAVWSVKVGLDDGPGDLPALRWGKRLQRPIADGYIEETGRALIDPGPWTLFRSVPYPWLVATPDYLIRRPATGDPGLLEIKNASAYTRAEWALRGTARPVWHSNPSAIVGVGVHVGGDRRVLGGSELVYRDFVPHPGVAEWILEDVAAFWRLVQSEIPPRPLDGSEATTRALRRLYPTATPGAVVVLPREAMAWDEYIVAGERQIKTLTDTVEAARNELRAALGDAESGTLADGVMWTHKTETRKGYTKVVEPWSGRVLRRRVAR